MNLGIVGNGSDKFTEMGEREARSAIRAFIAEYEPEFVVSGHSPVGGIDIWAEEIARERGVELDLKVPEKNQWNPPGGYGYKARNIDIAKVSDVLAVILADQYPEEYTGKRFQYCYHHSPAATDHVKSGGCWTGKTAVGLGKTVIWQIVPNYPLQSE
jgi:hypothetical protein